MAFDLIVRDGKVIDGTGNPWYKADIGIIGDRIAAIGHLGEDSLKTVDASGQVVCPGFIDMHTHSELAVFAEPELSAKLLQGITTEVLTQDGFSVAPITPQTRAAWQRVLSVFSGTLNRDWDWLTLKDYMNALERIRPSVNFATLVPFGNVRSNVLGFGSVVPNQKQLDEMKALVAEGMAEGAFGMSLGLIYQPQMWATKHELTELYRVVGRHNGMMVVHMRNEGDLLLEATDEVIEICRDAGCALHISHLKVAGRNNWEKAKRFVARLEEARERGLDVTFDQYPYTAASTFFHAILPPWATEGGIEAITNRLKDPGCRRQITWEIEHLTGPDRPTDDPVLRFWENFAALAGWEGILITSVGSECNRALEGKTVARIAAERGQDPLTFALDFLLEEACNITMAAFISAEENVKRFLGHEFGMIGSDGLLVGRPHPRAYGTFPRVLGTYVRDAGVLSLPQMVRRMTSLPAQRLGLSDRGLLRSGMKADLVVFDPLTVRDTATYEDPCRYPVGIDLVVVNGVVAAEGGHVTGQRSGHVLKRNG